MRQSQVLHVDDEILLAHPIAEQLLHLTGEGDAAHAFHATHLDPHLALGVDGYLDLVKLAHGRSV